MPTLLQPGSIAGGPGHSKSGSRQGDVRMIEQRRTTIDATGQLHPAYRQLLLFSGRSDQITRISIKTESLL